MLSKYHIFLFFGRCSETNKNNTANVEIAHKENEEELGREAKKKEVKVAMLVFNQVRCPVMCLFIVTLPMAP